MNMGGFIPQSFINEAGPFHTELVTYNASTTKEEGNGTLKYWHPRMEGLWENGQGWCQRSLIVGCHCVTAGCSSGSSEEPTGITMLRCSHSAGTGCCSSAWLGVPHFIEGSCKLTFHIKNTSLIPNSMFTGGTPCICFIRNGGKSMALGATAGTLASHWHAWF